MTDILVSAENLSLIRGQRLLFKQLNFTLARGQAMHLIGHNGCGKTSLFNLLIGSLTPDTGQLSVLGKSYKEFESDDYRQLIYLGHQTAIKHELTVGENLSLNAAVFDNIAATETMIQTALSAVELAAFSAQPAGKLSAGQKRRVMLARLWLSMEDENAHKALWLLDEPLTALDVAAIDALQSLIDQHLSFGGGVIFTSHQAFELSHPMTTLTLGGDVNSVGAEASQ